MNKIKIRDFFNRLSSTWDEGMVRDEEVITKILDNAEVSEGKDILDVASGTGVLFPDYLKRKPASLTAIDISEKMCEIARKKYGRENIEIICGDAEEYDFNRKYDCIIIYNAFPHFTNQELLIRRLSSCLKEGGVLTIAHGMSRERINRHHENTGDEISRTLPEIEELRELFEKYLDVTVCISNDRMYQIAGRRK